jgi:hypothetical protein
MEDRPKRKETLVTEEVNDDFLVADFRESTMHVLNPTAAAVFEMCDGQRSISEIAAILAEYFRMPAEAVGQDVLKIVGEFQKLGFLEEPSVAV